MNKSLYHRINFVQWVRFLVLQLTCLAVIPVALLKLHQNPIWYGIVISLMLLIQIVPMVPYVSVSKSSLVFGSQHVLFGNFRTKNAFGLEDVESITARLDYDKGAFILGDILFGVSASLTYNTMEFRSATRPKGQMVFSKVFVADIEGALDVVRLRHPQIQIEIVKNSF